jgi:hypothetical protein
MFVPVHTIKTYWGVETWLHKFSTTALNDIHLYSSTVKSPGKECSIPLHYESGLAPEPLWILWRRDKLLASEGNRKTIFVLQLVA